MHDYDATSRFVTTATGRLHFHEAGTGTPLILLHGSGPGVDGWTNFAGNLPAFTQSFRVLILDLPGFGKSDPAPGYPADAAVMALGAFMDSLSIPCADLLGNSMGGIVAARFASLYPDRVCRLCSIGGVGGQSLFSPFPSEGLNLLVDFTEAPTRDRLAAWMRSMVYDPATVTEALIDERWQRASRPEALSWARRLYSRAAIQAMNAAPEAALQPWAHLPLIQAPTLLAWGRDDRVAPLDRAILPMRLIPKCELHVFFDCGHWAMIERQEEFENVVSAFFRRPWASQIAA
jgi:2-hydroxy-6-oxonona-2,4-dienedioate hydrolase